MRICAIQYVLRFNVLESRTVAFAESGCKGTTKIWNMQVLRRLNQLFVHFYAKLSVKGQYFFEICE